MVIDLLKSAHHPSELIAMLKIKMGGSVPHQYKEDLATLAKRLGDREFCYAALNKVSRSFAVVIQQLPAELRDPVCVFYLVLRGLDSVEDDMTYPAELRLPLLRNFHRKCYEEGWKLEGVGDSADYRALLANFDKVIRVFLGLDEAYRTVIADICKQMGNGMADYAERKVNTLEDYDHYCHYVAGLVGIGLSALFSASGLESEQLREDWELANSMGLMLQKTNIARDYYEDLNLGRTFWPRQIWGKYASRLEEFHAKPSSPESLACINEMVCNALQHVSNCILYLHRIRNRQVFRFCAIPQVMAMATLAKIYNNPNVFTEVVKIRKGIAAKMMLDTNDMERVRYYIEKFAREIQNKMSESDPNYALTRKRLNRIYEALDDVRFSPESVRARCVEELVLF
ncbi:MAG: squalene synthase [Chitinophagales bacterium]|nr:squalene synthase [Chitinophagales bacterium]MDW8418099.1 squalene synthase [Chitinophagales bacterium]